MWKIKSLLLVVALALLAAAPAGAIAAEVCGPNLLRNPGAETGTMSGWWSFTTGVVRAVSTSEHTEGVVEPYDGGFFFEMSGGPAEVARMSQFVSISGLSGRFRAGGWVQTRPAPSVAGGLAAAGDGDYGQLAVIIRDSHGIIIAECLSDELTHPSAGGSSYGHFAVEALIPEGAHTAEFLLQGALVEGERINVYYDDLFFCQVTEVQPPAVDPEPKDGHGGCTVKWLVPVAHEDRVVSNRATVPVRFEIWREGQLLSGDALDELDVTLAVGELGRPLEVTCDALTGKHSASLKPGDEGRQYVQLRVLLDGSEIGSTTIEVESPTVTNHGRPGITGGGAKPKTSP